MASPEYDPANYDQGLTEQRPSITAEFLWEDNHSSIADKRRSTWFETRAQGNLIKVRTCSDSRVILPDPDREVVVRYIAAGRTPPAPAKLLLENSGVKGAVIMAHFDGTTADPGKTPEGCGGLKVKDSHKKNGKSNGAIDKFVDEHVFDPDPIIQAVKSAKHLAAHANKPVLAVAQDHRSSKVYPIASYYPWHDSLVTIEDGRVAEAQIEYESSVLYENGLEGVTIREEDIPPALMDFIPSSRNMAVSVKEANPHFYEASSTQDPPLIVLSTSIISFPTRFPFIGNRPGRVFEVFVPRTRIGFSIGINPEDLQPSLEQMEYPIKTSLENHAQDGKSFANTNTILIDTEYFAHSVVLALRFIRKEESISKWLELPNHKILLSETTEGVITRIEEFKP